MLAGSSRGRVINRGPACLPVGRMIEQFFPICLQRLALAAQGVADRRGKARVDEAMERARAHRQESAGNLVLALCTRLEALQAVTDAVVDALVVAGLEMQSGDRLVGAPVAAVKGFGTAQAERRGNDPACRVDRARRRPGAACCGRDGGRMLRSGPGGCHAPRRSTGRADAEPANRHRRARHRGEFRRSPRPQRPALAPGGCSCASSA